MIPARLILFLLPAAALAQVLPPLELYSGYSFARIPYESGLTAASLNGWQAAVKLGIRPRFAWVFDFGGGYGERRMVHYEFQPRETFPGAVRHHTFMLGPEVKMLEAGRFTVNIRALIGALWISTLTLPLEDRVTEHVSLRLLQPELVVASLGASNVRRLRLSAGVVFTFGGP